MKKIYMVLISLILLSTFVFANGQGETADSRAAEKFKIAFIYIGEPGDLGWTFEHDHGRQEIEKKFGDKVETTFIENIPEGPDSGRVIRQYAQDGYNMIIATSYGYMDSMVEVAAEFPDIYFEHNSGYMDGPNLSTYFGKIYQPRYLSGLVAGSMTESNIVGYVAAFPIPEVLRGINAFTLGIREVNPDAIVKVVWTNSWTDPTQEREAAIALLDAGADVIAQHQDTIEPQKAAKERGKMSIGYHSDMGLFVGDSVLTSPIWDWSPYYNRIVAEAMEGTRTSEQYWGGMDEGVVLLADLSDRVPADVKQLVQVAQAKIVSGDWDVFYGPINDNEGNVLVPEGDQMDFETLQSMQFYVEGVDGKL